MRTLPVLLDLREGHLVLVGATPAALAKLAFLAARGAPVRWYPGRHGTTAAEAFAAKTHIDIRLNEVQKPDLEGARAVIVAAGEETARRVARWARELGLAVNVVDRPELSTFHFPAIVARGDVVVAIGTGGSSPVLARRLRAEIEALLPERLGELAAFLGRLRGVLRARAGRGGAQDRRFWEEIIDGPIARHVLEGRSDQAERLLARPLAPARREGRVTLVGAGPGDPDLLTLRALQALQDADVIFHDALVGPEILARARRDARKIAVGKRKGAHSIDQAAINRALIKAASSGLNVVRLKGGDPFLFGRGGEEMAALEQAGIAVSVVPGVTAALGCAAEAGLPLTFRDEANRVAILTGHLAGGDINWSGLDDPKTTLAIYMGLSSAAAIRAGLLQAGRSPETPAAIIARGTTRHARTVTGPLQALPALAAQAGQGPALLVIGDVVARSRIWRKTAARALAEVA